MNNLAAQLPVRLISTLLICCTPCIATAQQRQGGGDLTKDATSIGAGIFQLDDHVWAIPDGFNAHYVDEGKGIYLQFGWKNGRFSSIHSGGYDILLNVHIRNTDFDYTNWNGPDFSSLGLIKKPIFIKQKIKGMTYIGSVSGEHYFSLDKEPGAFVSCFGVRGVITGDNETALENAIFECDLSFYVLKHTSVLVMAGAIKLDAADRVLEDSLITLKSFVR